MRCRVIHRGNFTALGSLSPKWDSCRFGFLVNEWVLYCCLGSEQHHMDGTPMGDC